MQTDGTKLCCPLLSLFLPGTPPLSPPKKKYTYINKSRPPPPPLVVRAPTALPSPRRSSASPSVSWPPRTRWPPRCACAVLLRRLTPVHKLFSFFFYRPVPNMSPTSPPFPTLAADLYQLYRRQVFNVHVDYGIVFLAFFPSRLSRKMLTRIGVFSVH